MGLTANVVTGEIIESAWGNEIRDRTCQVFATVAERDAQWPNPPDGSLAYTADRQEMSQYKTGFGWARGLWVPELDVGGATNTLIIHPFSADIQRIVTDAATLRIQSGTTHQLDLLVDRAEWTASNGIAVTSTPVNSEWTSKAIRVTRPPTAAGLAGVAFNDSAIGNAIQMQAYQPTAGYFGFHFVTYNNLAHCHVTAAAYNIGVVAATVDNVAPLDVDALSIVGQLQPVTYQAKPSAPANPPTQPTTVGLLADDVADVYDAAVARDAGDPISYDLVAVVAVLTKAVQELTARLETLEAAP